MSWFTRNEKVNAEEVYIKPSGETLASQEPSVLRRRTDSGPVSSAISDYGFNMSELARVQQDMRQIEMDRLMQNRKEAMAAEAREQRKGAGEDADKIVTTMPMSDIEKVLATAHPAIVEDVLLQCAQCRRQKSLRVLAAMRKETPLAAIVLIQDDPDEAVKRLVQARLEYEGKNDA